MYVVRSGKFWFDQSKRAILSFIYYIHLISLCVGEYEETMPEKFHLDAGIFREHGLDAELFRADNADLAVFRGLFVRFNKLRTDTA